MCLEIDRVITFASRLVLLFYVGNLHPALSGTLACELCRWDENPVGSIDYVVQSKSASVVAQGIKVSATARVLLNIDMTSHHKKNNESAESSDIDAILKPDSALSVSFPDPAIVDGSCYVHVKVSPSLSRLDEM